MLARMRASVGEARAALAQTLQDWRSQAATELAAAQGEFAARRRAMPALAERLERTIVRAPLSGRINRVLVTTVGGTVPPGGPLVEIVPSEESLLVEARIRPQDIASVRLNQKAKVNVTAYDPSVYGGLEGQVVAISPDAVQDERSGETFYVVRVRTATNALKDQQGRPLPIGAGMIADVSLLGNKRTILQYVLTPITRLSETALRE
jgi:adhesin transport system membrane fusion protein